MPGPAFLKPRPKAVNSSDQSLNRLFITIIMNLAFCIKNAVNIVFTLDVSILCFWALSCTLTFCFWTVLETPSFTVCYNALWNLLIAFIHFNKFNTWRRMVVFLLWWEVLWANTFLLELMMDQSGERKWVCSRLRHYPRTWSQMTVSQESHHFTLVSSCWHGILVWFA